MQTPTDSTIGVVLAAGAGRRFGKPKALVVEHGVAWVARAANLLRDAGCSRILVVLGASADAVRPLVPAFAEVVLSEHWENGMAASLRSALAAAARSDAASVLLTLVDLPALPLAAAQRVLESGAPLAQATWSGIPGHPVLIARSHWATLAAAVTGDVGARTYLDTHGAVAIECADLGDGSDVDLPRARPGTERSRLARVEAERLRRGPPCDR